LNSFLILQRLVLSITRIEEGLNRENKRCVCMFQPSWNDGAKPGGDRRRRHRKQVMMLVARSDVGSVQGQEKWRIFQKDKEYFLPIISKDKGRVRPWK